MKAQILENRDDEAELKFWPPGFPHPLILPIISKGKRDGTKFWTFNGNLEKPTLKPSIRAMYVANGPVSHFWLTDGKCIFLADSTDGNAGKILDLLDLEVDKAAREC